VLSKKDSSLLLNYYNWRNYSDLNFEQPCFTVIEEIIVIWISLSVEIDDCTIVR
jgi:hypothetical protein